MTATKPLRKARIARRAAIYAALGIAALYYLIPLWAMVATSVKGLPEITFGNILAPPIDVTLAPWAKAWSGACTGLSCRGLSVGFWNSVRILVPSVSLSVALASLGGYVFSLWRFQGSEAIFALLLVGAFIPYQVVLYPMVLALGSIGLYGSVWGLILVHVIFAMPINTLMFRNYFASLPPEILKAARMDGAGFWALYLRILLPMSLPIAAVSMILQVTVIWNDFLLGLIFTTPKDWPMTVQLNNMVNSFVGAANYNVNMAATLISALVPLSIYLVSGRLFVRGIAAGAVKG